MASQKSRDDLSTEQILESIGRIVSEGESRGASPDARAPNAPAVAEEDDVLDLVEMVDEQGNVIPLEQALEGAPAVSYPRSADRPAARDSAEGRADEERMAETLRPMLERWLDTHEPQVVERLVRREIERAQRRSEPA